LQLTYSAIIVYKFNIACKSKNVNMWQGGMSELLTPNEVAKRLKVDRITIYRWVKSGRLQAKRLPDSQIRIEANKLDNLLTKIKE